MRYLPYGADSRGWVMVLEGVVIAAALTGLFTMVSRLMDYRIQRSRLQSQNASDDSNAAKNLSEAYAKISDVKDELMELFKLERDECRREIAELRQRYSSDIERLNGERDVLVKRVNDLSSELQKITEPKVDGVR